MSKNNYKKKWIFLIWGLTILFFAGCGNEEGTAETTRPELPVKVMEVHTQTLDDALVYVGIVDNEQTVKKSFKVQGRILSLEVDEGQTVKMGEVLATLEPLDLDFAIEATKADVTSASAQVSKARDAYDFAKENASDSEVLFSQGAISKLAYDQAVLNLDMAKSDLDSARELLRQAQVSLDQKNNLRTESVLYAPFDGQVVSVLVEEGEMISAGYPAVVVSNQDKVMYTGVSQADVVRIEPGMSVAIEIDGIKTSGQVRTVNSVPDSQTRTYQVTIDMNSPDYPVGAVGQAAIIVGERVGMKIPVQSVLSGSADYVYIVEGEKAVKRIIRLGQVSETDVYVEGLKDGDLLVVEGMKNLKDSSPVRITKE